MIIITKVGFPVAQMVENLHVMQETGEGHGTPLQYSCLENHVDRGAWGLLSIGSHRVRHD